MKNFILYIIKITSTTLILMVVLDLVFTGIFNAGKERSKYLWVRNMENESLDYIILGSSRALYHINADTINDTYHLNGYNLGDYNQGTSEMYLMLKTFFHNNNKAQKVFIQLDDNWNNQSPNKLASAEFMPFIREEPYLNYYIHEDKYKKYIYIPFVRYIEFWHNKGFRALLTTLLDDTKSTSRFGFMSLSGKIDPQEIKTQQLKLKNQNVNIEKIIELAKVHNTELVFFTAPTLEYDEESFDQFKDILPNYYNYSQAISAVDLYWDLTHLNKDGARQFTELFYQNSLYKEKIFYCQVREAY